jgi:hypothetical protein
MRSSRCGFFKSYHVTFWSSGSTVCFVTNLGEEKPQEEKKIRVTQRFLRNGEPLADQVTDDMFQAVRDKSISQEDMDYWFNEHEGDIEAERWLKPLEEIPTTDFTVRNEVWESVRILCCTQMQLTLSTGICAIQYDVEHRQCSSVCPSSGLETVLCKCWLDMESNPVLSCTVTHSQHHLAWWPAHSNHQPLFSVTIFSINDWFDVKELFESYIPASHDHIARVFWLQVRCMKHRVRDKHSLEFFELTHRIMQEPIDTLREGDVRTAEIIGIHLYHGAVVDLGTQYHGIIPVNEAQWPQVVDTLTLERSVKVRVHEVRPSGNF